jgi:hypothetical protein
MTRTYFVSAAVVFCALFLAGCAGQQAPDGGPIDTEPPEILSVYPAPNTVNYSDTRIAFEFDKYVDRRSVEEAIFISPFVTNVEFQWSGREVEILFHEPLKHNTTYVITVGTDVKDVHNSNRMAHAFTLAFSTGTAIDRGSITGKVFDPKPDGVMIFAYRLNGVLPDTVNPSKLKPDYINQTGREGTFQLSHLAYGTYRLFAIRDEYHDLLYNPEVDAAGTLTHDVDVTERDTLQSGCNFTLAVEDTSAPRLLMAEATDERHLVLKFNENLDTARIAPGMFSIVDTLTTRPLEVTHAFAANPSLPAAVSLRTGLQEKDAGYRVSVTGVYDCAAHPVSSLARTLSFRGSGAPDTAAPRLLLSTLRDTTTRVFPDETFRFDFSDALSPAVEHAFTLMLGDSAAVPFALRHASSAGVVLAPRQDLLPKTRYAVRLRLDSIRSISGKGVKDSVRVFRYTTIDPENYSSIDGVVMNLVFADTSSVIAEALAIGEKSGKNPRTVVRKDRTFSFPLLSEGLYGIRIFSDRNKNGQLDAGRVFPYGASEPFVIGRDTIKVRARWPVEGVIIR